jgi:predicted AAA+ superfamily ATPase
MIYPRKIYPELLSHAKTPQVTVLTGMRRTGKTTLVKQLLSDLPNKNSIYLDFQRLDIRELFEEKNYEAIRNNLISQNLSPENMIVAIDEIQLAPDSPSAIKYLYDHYGIKFIVTGSSSYYLKNLFSESLSGRKKIFELYPLDFGEFLTFKNVNFTDSQWKHGTFDKLEYSRLSSYYNEYIRFGGFPQVVLLENEKEKIDNLKDIFSSYVSIDIKSLADFSDERNLYNLAKLLASRVGSRIEYSKMSRLTGLSRPTVANYISFFEKTYLISTIGVFTKNIGREIVKSRKLYFCDTGIANILTDLNSGSQFENSLYNQLVRNNQIQYYSLKNGNEIDFIIDGKLAAEAKETPTSDDLSNLKKIASIANVKSIQLIGRNLSPKFDNYIWGGSII